jgi:glucose/arabinose dehydrogenase
VKRSLTVALVAVLALALAGEAAAKTGSGRGGVKLSKVGRFNSPVFVAVAPGSSTLYVVEQPGRIMALSKGKRRTFLDISGKVTFGGEQGLLSVAFPPNHQQSGLFYVYYVTSGGDLAIEEYRRVSATAADPGSARRLLTVNHPGAGNHNGGQLQFGPDGFLYAGTGDGGSAGDPGDDAQNPNSLLGKMLRINPAPSGPGQYSIPAGNPFAGGGGAPEVYSLGLRNPFRFSFDLVSAGQPRIAIGDVGQNRFEEVDYENVSDAAGANFGWNDFEGFEPFAGAFAPGPSRHDRPIRVYSLGGAACALIGGYVSRSKQVPSIRGRYVYGDFCTGKLQSFVPSLGGAQKNRKLSLTVPQLTSFGEGVKGALYATSLDGPVFKLVAKKKKKKRG